MVRTHVRTAIGRNSAGAARVERSARAVHERLAGAARDVEDPADLRVRAVLQLVHDERTALPGGEVLEVGDELRDRLTARDDRDRAAAGIGDGEVLGGDR